MVMITSDDFETGYPIQHIEHSRIIQKIPGKSYITKENIASLPESSILYFIRKSKYLPYGEINFSGYPDFTFLSSELSGPYNKKPEGIILDDLDNYINGINIRNSLVTKLIPQEIMPIELKRVSLLHGGFPNDVILNIPLWINKEKIKLEEIATSSKVWDFIKKNFEISKDYNSIYRTATNELLISHSDIFGINKFVEEFLQESGLYKLSIQGLTQKRLGVKILHPNKYRKKGFAYNLSFDGKNIEEIVNGKNVIF